MPSEPAGKSLLLAALLAALSFNAARSQVVDGLSLVQARLVADTTTISPGQPFLVGIVLEMAPGWHTYWKAPGDAGIPTTVKWQLPEGFTAGQLIWPIPQRIIEPGDIQVHAYKGTTVLFAEIHPPATLTPRDQLELKARLDWLVCEKICIPGGADLTLTFPQQSTAIEKAGGLFREFLPKLPQPGPPPFPIRWQSQAGKVSLTVTSLPEGAEVDFFPISAGDHQSFGHPSVNYPPGGPAKITFAGSLPASGLLVVKASDRTFAWEISSPPEAAPEALGQADPSTVSPPATIGLLSYLLMGALGGLILNLMPCVLPVISLKIFGFMRQAGETTGKIFAHGLAFALGMFVWFGGLAAVVVGLKSLGSNVTWAFQFQNPWFNLIIITILFVFALNLFGVFEIVPPGQVTSSLAGAAGHSGYLGSFFQGAFATILATPCTAPFLGSALGFAFTQDAPVIFAMFFSVALGMALPYLLLSARPAWIRCLPKPGPWMEQVKQFMGFPLLATAVWLLSVLGTQKGLGGVIWSLSFLLGLGVALWVFGCFCKPSLSSRMRLVGSLIAVLIAASSTWFFVFGLFARSSAPPSPSSQAPGEGIPWVAFSEQTLAKLLAENRSVFVDFTADWCITCKFNERTAIDTPAVRKALAEAQIIPMKADWTNSNPEITRALARFGRVGVPFYVLYPSGRPDQPIVLPELLTEAIVLDAISRTR